MVNKKIAFCFSGQARTLDTTASFIKINLFQAAKEQGFDYDVFCAVEDDTDADKVLGLNPTQICKIRSNEVDAIIEEKYGTFIKTTFKQKYCYMNYSTKNIKNLLQQCFKIKSCNELKNKSRSTPYDLVVRLRFDTLFIQKVDFISIYENIQEGYIVCNTGQGKLVPVLPIQDFFFFGKESYMDIIGGCFDNFKDVFEKNEVPVIYKPFYYFFNFMTIINIKTYFGINKLYHVIAAIFSQFLFQTYTAESFFFHLIKNKGIDIKNANLSLILIRKDIEKSFIFLTKENKKI